MTKPNALASLATAVATSANTVTSLFTATTKGIGMLDAAVTKASNQQAARHVIDNEDFLNDLIRDSAHAQAEANRKVEDRCTKDPVYAGFYNEANARYSELLASFRTSTSSDATV